jgi:hypothetical protein
MKGKPRKAAMVDLGAWTSEPVRRSELEQLQVGWSLPGKPLNVACWIALMCPKLKDLTWHEAEGELEWRETKAMLEMLTWLEG